MQTFNALRLNEVLAAVLVQPVPGDVVIHHINTDTRTLQAGETFVALSGERFDGHDFMDLVAERGANAVMVECEQSTHLPQIVVTNTRLALAKIASQIRDDFVARGGKVIGLTGSVGKTTNKQMLASILSQVGNTHATKGNLNNDLGVPFTWFDLPVAAEFAVIEMGANHQGEIAYLTEITRPQVALITNAGDAHLEGFGGYDGIAKGKGELFAALTAGDTAVLNADDNYADYWRTLLTDGVNVLTFSRLDRDVDVFADTISADGANFTLHYRGQAQAVTLPSLGQHNVMNALGSAACALALGVSLGDIAAGLAQFVGAKGRLQKITCGELNLIDDTYNANPTSIRAAADIVAAQNGYCVMVLGDMAELGADELGIHGQLGRDLQGKADAFLCLGEKMAAFADNNTDATHFAEIAALNTALLTLVKTNPQATVLVKGSRSMQMERVIENLLQHNNKQRETG